MAEEKTTESVYNGCVFIHNLIFTYSHFHMYKLTTLHNSNNLFHETHRKK